jgi:hypothetical protein
MNQKGYFVFDSHWNYFLALEADLAATSRYVDFHESNYSTFSIEFARLIMAAAAEFEVVAKAICRASYGDVAEKANIVTLRDKIILRYPEFCTHQVNLPRFHMDSTPWAEWKGAFTPSWWAGYNAIKHNRSDRFAEANLKNAIDAASGLLVGLLYLHDAQYKKSLRVDGFLRPKILVPHGAGGEAWDGKFEYPIQPNKD